MREEGLKDQYRTARAQHDTYGAVKRALADPKGPLSRALRAASREALYDGSWLPGAQTEADR